MLIDHIKRFLKPALITMIIAAIHFAIWAGVNRSLPFMSAPPLVHGFAYSGFQADQSPLKKTYPSHDELASDLKLLREHTRRIRTYTAIENPDVISLASKQGMTVIAGAWINGDKVANKKEIWALKEQVAKYPNIERVIVGNETLLRGDVSVEELETYLDEVREVLDVPVSTAEPWHVWLKNPDLVKHVDFVAVHLLPYHEGVPVDKAVDYALERYRDLRHAFHRKRIVITEIGWPSRGPVIGGAVASPMNQTRFIREFLAKPTDEKLDYYLMEAFDQPWKIDLEGWAGAYWGMFDADRQPKFSLSGALHRDMHWIEKAEWSTGLAILPIFLLAFFFPQWRTAGHFSIGILVQACVTVLVVGWNLPDDYYFTLRDSIALVGLFSGMLLTSAVLLSYGVEFSEVMFKRRWGRSYSRVTPQLPEHQPFVSIHLACYNEPPAMVIATLESLANLEYENFEVLVIDNNTKDEALWKPVEAYVATLGSRFRFFHLLPWPGFKAGALNFALKETDPRAEVVGVVDADYVVTTDWLSALVPHFAETQVAVVQAPQAHRDWENNLFRRMCNWEFDGFFRIGMHHRHERNALIQHGTMTLVRAEALKQVGGWSEWCICEDTELGLRLLEQGMELRYVDEVFGRGLTPDTFIALKTQRARWAFGAMQILKRHWPNLIGKSKLSFGQRYHFLTGWFGWFGDALQMIFSIGSIYWTLAMLASPDKFSLPVTIMLTPVLGFLVCKAALGPVLYRKTMGCSWADIGGASLASLGMSHAIAQGVFAGLIQKKGVFKRTVKGGHGRGKLVIFAPISEEFLILLALILASATMLYTRGFHNIEAQLWVLMLMLQSLPYWGALACQIIAQLPDREMPKALPVSNK